MENSRDNGIRALLEIDKWTVLFYIALMGFGWLSICGASYSFEETDIFSLSTRSGMQIVWIGTSIFLGLSIMMLDHKMFDAYAYIIFAVVVVVLLATVFNPHQIKGSHSWLALGPLRVQPAEFGKFATSLALAKLMSVYGYDISNRRDFMMALLIIFIPMLCIVGQRETGSALVYLSFSLMLYREGMPGCILFTGIAMIAYFVVGVKYADVLLWGTPTSVGTFAALIMALVFTASMIKVYCPDQRLGNITLTSTLIVAPAAVLLSHYVVSFNASIVLLVGCAVLAIALGFYAFASRLSRYTFIMLFLIFSVGELFGSGYALNHILEDHQRTRINVLLGLDDDLARGGYNVHQSEIAIGSGGLKGKGFLNGTQTKLKFVPEQDTDFIFCTVGEEEGFVGSVGVLLLFLALILRLIYLAERQTSRFGRVYGYCVASVFIFHVFINVGMVLGLTPVIGIPLPFFSYGGSSLWGFTILLFIFLRIDAGREESRR